MVGLNLTHQAVAGPAEIRRIRALGNCTSEIVAQFLDFHSAQYRALLGLDGAPLHDVCAVAWLVDPTLIEGRPLHVAVELYGQHTRGMTVCDFRHLLNTDNDLVGEEGVRQGLPRNAEVGLRLDVAQFFDLLVDTLAGYP